MSVHIGSMLGLLRDFKLSAFEGDTKNGKGVQNFKRAIEEKTAQMMSQAAPDFVDDVIYLANELET